MADTYETIRNHAKTAMRITGQMALQGEQVPLDKQDVRRRLQEEHEEYQQWPAKGRRHLQREEQYFWASKICVASCATSTKSTSNRETEAQEEQLPLYKQNVRRRLEEHIHTRMHTRTHTHPHTHRLGVNQRQLRRLRR